MAQYDLFKDKLDRMLYPLLDRNIIIYGCNRGGDYIRWFLEYYYSKKTKVVMDRWELSHVRTIPHLWALYYIYDKNDVIINATPYKIPDEFNDTGEDWDRVLYKEDQIIDLWNLFYGKYYDGKGRLEEYPQISFYDWLEAEYQLDIVGTVRRRHVQGGHGYFPTDFRMVYEGIRQYGIDAEEDCILDIGAGKGSGIFSFIACGFKKIGAVEYTDSIYQTLKSNLRKAGVSCEEHDINGMEQAEMSKECVICYQGDAALMKNALDVYNWFFMFNPFSQDVLRQVIDNICESIQRKPRECFIFYVEPIGHQYILGTGLFQCDRRILSDYSDVSYYGYIYRNGKKGGA